VVRYGILRKGNAVTGTSWITVPGSGTEAVQEEKKVLEANNYLNVVRMSSP
jgi:hypothetical protein